MVRFEDYSWQTDYFFHTQLFKYLHVSRILTIGSLQGEWETKDKKKKKRQASTGKDKKSEEGTGGTSDWDDSAPPPPSGNNGGAGDGKEWKVGFPALLIVIRIFLLIFIVFIQHFSLNECLILKFEGYQCILHRIFVPKLNFTYVRD